MNLECWANEEMGGIKCSNREYKVRRLIGNKREYKVMFKVIIREYKVIIHFCSCFRLPAIAVTNKNATSAAAAGFSQCFTPCG